jgi:hypothetical protein
VYPGSNNCLFAYCVLSEAAAELFGRGSLNFYWQRMGLFRRVDNLAGLAEAIGSDEGRLRETLQQYEQSSRNGSLCPLTGKSVFPSVVGPEGPYYVAAVTPTIHYTMGGCRISAGAEVLEASSGRAIEGLFGAGEVTGGVHGGNRLGGNSLLECVVFGRVAGERAVVSSRANGPTAKGCSVKLLGVNAGTGEVAVGGDAVMTGVPDAVVLEQSDGTSFRGLVAGSVDTHHAILNVKVSSDDAKRLQSLPHSAALQLTW